MSEELKDIYRKLERWERPIKQFKRISDLAGFLEERGLESRSDIEELVNKRSRVEKDY